jgi:hypothetical protein
MLVLPQANNSKIRVPNKADVIRLVEAYNFFRKCDEGRTVLLERQGPDDIALNDAGQGRLSVTPEFEAIVQQQIQFL